MRIQAATADEYFASVEASRRQDLARLRELVRKVVPAVEEGLEHGMPHYRAGGGIVCALACQKHYLALYVHATDLIAENAPAFAHLDVGKSCIRFKRATDLPLAVVAQILTKMAARARAQGRSSASAPPATSGRKKMARRSRAAR